MAFGRSPVFYINLESSVERRASIKAQLRAAGVENPVRVPAFDGRGLDLSQLPDCDTAFAHRYLGRPLRGAEYGCYRSHLAALEQFLATDSPYGIVFEDDAKIDADMLPVIDQAIAKLAARNKPWDVIHISAGRMKIYTRMDALGGGHDLVCAHYFPMLATALLWSREGARNFVTNHSRVTMPVDTMFREVEVRRGLGFAIWPAVVQSSGATSDIDGDGYARKAKDRSWYYGLAKQDRLWRNKIIAFIRKHTRRV